jgi:CRP/FNR family transcriptional regulator, nitrogen fixation regulation protein
MSTQLAYSADQVAPAISAILARGPWMRASDAAPERVGALNIAGPVLHFAQDREIYGEGDTADVFFKVVSGVVRTCKFLSDGRRQIDAFYITGDVFGLEAGDEYTLSAEAVCDCSVVSYRRSGVAKLAASDQGLSQQFFAYAMRSLARAQEHALLLGRRSAMEKVAAFLVEWAGYSPDRKVISLAMTRQDIADYLGLTIETVSRTLSQLERESLIEVAARLIRLTNLTALQELNS